MKSCAGDGRNLQWRSWNDTARGLSEDSGVRAGRVRKPASESEALTGRVPPKEGHRPQVKIYTDGACSGNPGPGGWAAVLVSGAHRREISGFEPNTTNNRMELRAAIEALRLLKRPASVDLYTDSQYVQQGIQEWLPRWKTNGWRTANRRAVKNADLWRELDRLCSSHQVRWHWLRGHAGHPENERCDRLARAEIARHRGEPGHRRTAE